MAQESQTKQPDEMDCTRCGAVIKVGVQFCPQCGASAPGAGGSRPTVFSAIRLCRERFWGIALIEVTFVVILLATFVATFILTLVATRADPGTLFLAILTILPFLFLPAPVAFFYILGVPQYQAAAANWAAWGRALAPRRLLTASVYVVVGFPLVLLVLLVSLIPVVGQVIGLILGTVWLLGFAIMAFENVGPLSIWARFWHLVKLGRSQRLLPSLLRLGLLGIVINIAASAAGLSIGFLLADTLPEDAGLAAGGVVILVFFAFGAAAFMLYTPIVFAWITQVYSLLLQAVD